MVIPYFIFELTTWESGWEPGENLKSDKDAENLIDSSNSHPSNYLVSWETTISLKEYTSLLTTDLNVQN